jgi:transposase
MASAERSAKPEVVGPRRIELITGPERRREWSVEDKERIVAESYAGRDTVCGVARRHGLSPQQLFTWRRDAKRRGAVQTIEPMPFAPVVVATPARISAEPDGKRKAPRRATRRVDADASPIVIEAGAVVVRIGRGAETNTVEAILRALRGTP